MSYLKKISNFNLREKPAVFLYTLANIIINRIPKTLIKSHLLFSQLADRNIRIKKTGESNLFQYTINHQPYNILLKRKSSDPDVFRQIILEEEYNTVISLARQHQLHINSFVDAGANIGLTTLYMHAHYPEMKVIAIEPSASTFARMKKMLEINRLENIECLEKGLWYKKTHLTPDLSFRDGLDWSFRLVESDVQTSGSIQTTTIEELMQDYELAYIDFLKIDIEGGEAGIFGKYADLNWLKKIKMLAIEIHDEFNIRDRIEGLLIENGFTLSYSGELTIGINQNLVKPQAS